MAIKMMEDFSSNSLANLTIAGRWDASGTNQLTLSSSGGPFSEGAMTAQALDNGLTAMLRKSTITGGLTTTCYSSAWVKIVAYASFAADVFSIWNGATVQCSLGFNSSGQFYVTRGISKTGTVLATGTTFPLAYWVWLQWKVVIGTGTSGSTEVRANGNTVIAPTASLNTAATGVAAADGISVGVQGTQGVGFSHQYTVADYIMNDSSGSNNNSFLPGAAKVYFFLPTSNGTTDNYTPLSGSNWQRVSNNPSTGDSSFNSSVTATNKDEFNHATIASAAATILGVQTQHINRIDDATAHTGQCVLYDGSTEVDAPSAVSLASTVLWIEAVQETNLTSGVAFVPSDINTLQFGYKLVT